MLTAGEARGSAAASMALAYWDITQKQWEEAVRHIVRALLYPESENVDLDPGTLISLGRCLAHAEQREFEGLAGIGTRALSEETKRIAALLVAFALEKRYPDAAEAAATGDVTTANTLASGSRVFVEPPSVPPPPEPTPPTQGKPRARQGLINAFHARGQSGWFGFITEESTGQRYYFPLSNVIDDVLLSQLQQETSGQPVRFTTRNRRLSRYGRYDVAEEVAGIWDEDDGFDTSQTPITPSTYSAYPSVLPRGDSPYAKAKRAEHAGKFTEAEAALKKEIAKRGSRRPSAIKDLAQLLSRRGEDDEAIALLDKHRKELGELRSVDNQKATIYIKARKFRQAIEVFTRLLQETTGPRRIPLYRQLAYCRYRQGDYDGALADLGTILEISPSDYVARNQIDRIRKIQEEGIPLASDEDTDELRELAEWDTGLSSLAQYLLNSCDFSYVDERSKARGSFDKKDFAATERILEGIRGRRPAEKAKVLLNLAAMCQKLKDESEERSPLSYLRRALAFMGEAATMEGGHADTARCFLAEALSLTKPKDTDIDFPLTHLLATYIREPLAPGALQSPDGNIYVRTVLKHFEDDPTAWKNVEQDFPYYSALSSSATTVLARNLKHDWCRLENFLKSSEDLEHNRNNEIERLRNERNTLFSLQKQSYEVSEGFRIVASQLHELEKDTRFATDRLRLGTLANIADEAATYWVEQDYMERESKHGRLIAGLVSFDQEVIERPTKLSVEWILPVARKVKEAVENNFAEYVEKTRPSLDLRNVLQDDYYIPEDGIIKVRAEAELKAGGAPVEELQIVIRKEDGLEIIEPRYSPELLRAGQCREIEVCVRPSEEQLRDKAFTLRGWLHYRTRAGERIEDHEFSLPIRIGGAETFEEIENPYRKYSGGGIVEDPEMFKGREDLLGRMTQVITTGAPGQCFVLYGQKRSGKTSVIRQIRRRLERPNLVVEATIGEMDISGDRPNFFGFCLDKIEDRLSEVDVFGHDGLSWWPSREDIRREPLRTFSRTLREIHRHLESKGWEQPRLILLIDEFTYLYEYITDGIVSPELMRNWKAMLQLELFSAVVVGQDSMPKFKQHYANEFGVTHDERITYLSQNEARALASEPIFFHGASRYRGRAMERLIDLTAGNPFYLQIVCDRLVEHLNERKAPFITEWDLAMVEQSLTSGTDDLPIERFDPLITAAGETVAEASRETYLDLLEQIASHSSRNAGANPSDLSEFEDRARLLKDMKERDVIALDTQGRVSIRVQLFAEWLRARLGIGSRI